MAIKRMTDLNLAGKRVLIREDLNVPVKDGKVSSDARIRASLPTIKAAKDAGAKVMLMSHLGRPEEGVCILGRQTAQRLIGLEGVFHSPQISLRISQIFKGLRMLGRQSKLGAEVCFRLFKPSKPISGLSPEEVQETRVRETLKQGGIDFDCVLKASRCMQGACVFKGLSCRHPRTDCALRQLPEV